MKQYNFFSCATEEYIEFLHLIAIGLKGYKSKDVKYQYFIMLETDKLALTQYEPIFEKLQSEDFVVKLLPPDKIKSVIKPVKSHWSTYARLLLADMFPTLDKICYLDSDLLIVNRGIEEFYDKDLGEEYCYGAIDLMVMNNLRMELHNTQTKKYINGGVLLLNLKQMRKDKKNKELLNYCLKWPENLKCIMADQTLFNYAFGEKKLISHLKYNNTFLTVTVHDIDNFESYYRRFGYQNLTDSLKDAVVIHFAGIKPYKEIQEKYKREFPYREFAKIVYKKYRDQLLKYEKED